MSRFEGDGRVMLEALPQYVRKGTMPIRVKRSAARDTLHRFETFGCTSHSGRGGMLWVVIEYCETNGIGYTVEGEKGLGYHVTRTTKPLP